MAGKPRQNAKTNGTEAMSKEFDDLMKKAEEEGRERGWKIGWRRG